MANVAQEKGIMCIGEYGPILVREPGQASYGELIRYTRKTHHISVEDVAMLYGKIVEADPVTGRHIRRMEHNDNFFPQDSNRRWVLATLLRMPPELMAYLSLGATIPEQETETSQQPLFPISTRTIDTDEYYKTLQNYWLEGCPKGVKRAIVDIKNRIFLLREKVLFEPSLEKPMLTRLLCGYKILLADIAQDQQCFTEAEQYLKHAFTLAGERGCYDLQAMALKSLMVLFKNNGDPKAALGAFTKAERLEHPIAPQLWGQMLTFASQSEAYLAEDEATRLAALSRLKEAKDLAQTISTENFLFFATFDKQRYFLNSARACIESPIKKKRSPEQAEEYLKEAAKESTINGKSVNLGRQVANDLVQARIYCDQERYLVAATTAEQVLLTLKGLQSKMSLNRVAALFADIKERAPLEVEVMSLEAELMKAQQPYLFA